MKYLTLLAPLLLVFPELHAAGPVKTIHFPSQDGVEMAADVYIAHDNSAPFLVLFHKAQWSRGEYREIAPRLNDLGFNCMAVDARSGGPVEGVENETAKKAEKAGKGTTHADAVPDLKAAVDYAREHYAKGKLGVWGSSYSASLVLKLAGDDAGFADAVLAFSPGEYFAKSGKPGDWITASAKKLSQPVFITSAAKEKSLWEGIYAAIPSADKHSYLPGSGGQHGSQALWGRNPEHAGYWQAVETFLEKYLK